MRFWLNPHGGPEFVFTGKRQHAIAKARKYFRRHHNIEMGFYDQSGTFHPIRASSDYSGRRAGEGRARAAKRKKKSRRRRR